MTSQTIHATPRMIEALIGPWGDCHVEVQPRASKPAHATEGVGSSLLFSMSSATLHQVRASECLEYTYV